MIEAAVNLLRLLLGLGAVFFLGYGVLAVLLPNLREFRPLERAALSFGAGALPLTFWMLALTWWGKPFNLLLILGPLLALAGAALLIKRVIGGGGPGSETLLPSSPKPSPPTPYAGWDWLFVGLLALLFLYAIPQAMVYPMWAWDSIATWGLKAKVFYESRCLDLSFIDAHNYYPNLVPLLLTYLYFCLGQVSDHLVNGVFPLWGAWLLILLYSLLIRMGLSRRQALGATTFFALNGTVFIGHLVIAYADLALAYFALAAAGFLYLWLAGVAPRGSLALVALSCAGMTWCKYEGPPLAATLILAAALTLVWLRPPGVTRRLLKLGWPLAGLALGYLPWRIFSALHHIEVGTDHIQNIYPQQVLKAIAYLLTTLANPFYFGFLWPALALALIFTGRRLLNSPFLFLALYLGGNLLAIILAYGLAPTSAAEFPQYVRST
ncbi:MAG: hypothetical protein Q8M54_01370, partial [Desulfobaccales bacterium]|nr:hypothetical protein [Desulfobaccales bacterium]